MTVDPFPGPDWTDGQIAAITAGIPAPFVATAATGGTCRIAVADQVVTVTVTPIPERRLRVVWRRLVAAVLHGWPPPPQITTIHREQQ